MPVNLPPTFGSGQASSSIRPQASAHAQNFSTSKLNQHKERAKATTSMGRAMQKSAGSGPTSSIERILRGDTAVQDDEYGAYSDSDRDEVRTRLRYQHIRQMMKEKKAQEVQAAREEKKQAQKKKT